MKKVLKMMLVAALLVVTCVGFAGCGDDSDSKKSSKKNSSDTLVAVKDDETRGYSEKIEVSFKNDKADKIVYTVEFDSEETAERMKKYADFGDDATVELDGKKLIITMGKEAFSELGIEEDEDSSMETVRKSLEKAGYTVK